MIVKISGIVAKVILYLAGDLTLMKNIVLDEIRIFVIFIVND